MRLPRFTAAWLLVAIFGVVALAFCVNEFNKASRLARRSDVRDDYLSGIISREEARQYLGDEVDTLEKKVNSMPEP
jgi:hypothetical protein